MSWTREAMCDSVRELLHDARLVVVANREPYMHQRVGEDIRWIRPASGLVTALDPVLRACSGTWIAHGSGDADHDTNDQIDAVYRTKYRHYSAQYVDPMVAPAARAATIKLMPRSTSA